jgi:phospholipase C
MPAHPRPAEYPRPRPDLPPGTDLLPQIRHIIVLMQENHSHDNYLGMLPGRGDGLALGPDGRPVAANPRQDGQAVRLRHASSPVQVKYFPTNTWHASHLQYDDGRCDGFVRSVELTISGATAADATIPMTYWTGADLPFYYALASTFPLADRWFSSCLGPTFPNRRFLISGTAHGLIDDLPFGLVDYPPAGTIFDRLDASGISWVNYHSVWPVKVIAKHLLGTPGLIAARKLLSLTRFIPPLARTMIGSKSFTAELYPLGLRRCLRHLRTTEQLFAAADAGTLPAFAIVDPDFKLYSEENPQDIQRGESFAAEVIKRVMHGPGWPHTLLIWLYDEHGGYYDHVSPPAAPCPDDVPARSLLDLPRWFRALLGPLFAPVAAADAGPDSYDRYGFRVPAVIVSPYARPGYVCHEVLDHTSVLALLEQKWNLPPLTRRDAEAATPLAALSLDEPPAFGTPPTLPSPSVRWGSW